MIPETLDRPVPPDLNPWIQLLLATPVVVYGDGRAREARPP